MFNTWFKNLSLGFLAGIVLGSIFVAEPCFADASGESIFPNKIVPQKGIPKYAEPIVQDIVSEGLPEIKSRQLLPSNLHQGKEVGQGVVAPQPVNPCYVEEKPVENKRFGSKPFVYQEEKPKRVSLDDPTPSFDQVAEDTAKKLIEKAKALGEFPEVPSQAFVVEDEMPQVEKGCPVPVNRVPEKPVFQTTHCVVLPYGCDGKPLRRSLPLVCPPNLR